MTARSRFADLLAGAPRAPRWLVLAWLWATLPAAILQTNCPPGIEPAICSRFNNTVGVPFDLFPAPLAISFHVWTGGNMTAALAGVAAVTLLCHLTVVRFVPRTIQLHWFLAGVAAWCAVSWLTMFFGFWQMFGRPPFLPMLLNSLAA